MCVFSQSVNSIHDFDRIHFNECIYMYLSVGIFSRTSYQYIYSKVAPLHFTIVNYAYWTSMYNIVKYNSIYNCSGSNLSFSNMCCSFKSVYQLLNAVTAILKFIENAKVWYSMTANERLYIDFLAVCTVYVCVCVESGSLGPKYTLS